MLWKEKKDFQIESVQSILSLSLSLKFALLIFDLKCSQIVGNYLLNNKKTSQTQIQWKKLLSF